MRRSSKQPTFTSSENGGPEPDVKPGNDANTRIVAKNGLKHDPKGGVT